MRARALMAMIALLLGARLSPALVLKDQLYAVKTLGPNEAWVVGNFGSIYHTRDGGTTWESRESGTKLPLFGVDFADAEHGWAVGKSSLIVATTDGGNTWKPQKSAIPPEKHLFGVHAIDARTAWVVGDWGAMAVTHDGGATWEDRSLTDDVVLYDLSFPDAQHGFVAGEFGTVLATSDGGARWEKLAVGTEKTLFGIGFATPERGWVVGIDGLILRTLDGGRGWQVQRGQLVSRDIEDVGFLETLKNPGLYDVQVVGRYGAVIGDTGMVLTTADGGESWTPHLLPEDKRLTWVRGLSLGQGNGFLVGANGFTARLDGDQVVLPGGGAPAPSR